MWKTSVFQRRAYQPIVSPRMVPNYASVVEREAALSAWAAELGGSFDGWGCLSVKGTDHA